MITGRRPYLSDNAPIRGEKRNCIVAQRMANRPSISAALASSPAVNPFMIVGSTVIMAPSAATSSVTMRRMKISARRSFIAVPPTSGSRRPSSAETDQASQPVVLTRLRMARVGRRRQRLYAAVFSPCEGFATTQVTPAAASSSSAASRNGAPGSQPSSQAKVVVKIAGPISPVMLREELLAPCS